MTFPTSGGAWDLNPGANMKAVTRNRDEYAWVNLIMQFAGWMAGMSLSCQNYKSLWMLIHGMIKMPIYLYFLLRLAWLELRVDMLEIDV